MLDVGFDVIQREPASWPSLEHRRKRHPFGSTKLFCVKFRAAIKCRVEDWRGVP